MASTFNENPYLAVRQAFDAPWPGPRGEKVMLSNGRLTATIYPADGCRMTSLTAFGYELLRQWNPDRKAFQYGSFPMVPWVGRMGGATLEFAGKRYSLPMNKPPHALHGMACFAAWQTDRVTETCAEFSLSLAEPWPWAGTVTQRFELNNDTLIVTLTVACANEIFPAAAGWHPWFAKWTGSTDEVAKTPVGREQDELQLVFNADWQEEPGDNELPTGKRIAPQPGPWDDCFGFNDSMAASLIWPEKVRLDMTSPAQSMVVFNKQPDAACVEPLSGPPNCINTGPTMVTPEEPLVISTQWRISKI